MIGRNPDNGIPLEGILVSRRHAQITIQGNQLILQDLESTNGTWVNNQRVGKYLLQHGDVIQIGPARFRVKYPGLPTPGSSLSSVPVPPGIGVPCLIGIDGQKHAIPPQGLTIGRATDNALRLNGLMISRHHARIRNTSSGYLLEDLGSVNGTWVGGQRIRQHILQPGEQISMGEFRFTFSPAATPSPPPVGPRPASPLPSPAPASPTGGPGMPFDTYTITRDLGGGGMARVYQATDPQGRAVALKVLCSSDSYSQEKFLQEARLRLDHPNIVKIYGDGCSNGRPYIVMEFMDGGSLRDRLCPGQALPLNTVVPIITQVCAGLHFAHQHGVIHRDVKPENILFTSAGVAKIADFGIAKVTSSPSHTSAGMIIGTTYYLSYEQAQGEPVTPQSDVYSLGVVLYEMLTGYRPFEGEALTVLNKHLTEVPLPLQRRNSAIPLEVETVVLKAMEKDISRRFKTTLELSQALQRVV